MTLPRSVEGHKQRQADHPPVESGQPTAQTSEIPLRDARNALSRLADAAHAGEVVTLTKHGRPWARLTPVEWAQGARRRFAARWAVAGVDLDP